MDLVENAPPKFDKVNMGHAIIRRRSKYERSKPQVKHESHGHHCQFLAYSEDRLTNQNVGKKGKQGTHVKDAQIQHDKSELFAPTTPKCPND